MKRYRVWQANREVFLWPENWLFPELRDDQSPIYQTTASASCRRHHRRRRDLGLSRLPHDLEEVAKLEPCGIYYVPATGSAPSAQPEISYVVARTGAHRKHFFRQAVNGICLPGRRSDRMRRHAADADHLECGRRIGWAQHALFLFWLKILKHQPAAPGSRQIQPQESDLGLGGHGRQELRHDRGDRRRTDQHHGGSVLERVLQWQVAAGEDVDINRPAEVWWQKPQSATDPSFEQVRNRIRLLVMPFLEGVPASCLNLAIVCPFNDCVGELPTGPVFVLHNTHSFRHSSPMNQARAGATRRIFETPMRSLLPHETYNGSTSQGTFSIAHIQQLHICTTPASQATRAVFSITSGNRDLSNLQIGPGDSTGWPFLYEDRRNQFYVDVDKSWNLFPSYPGFGVNRVSALTGMIDIPLLTVGQTVPLAHPAICGDDDRSCVGPSGRRHVDRGPVRQHRPLASFASARFNFKAATSVSQAAVPNLALTLQTRGT